MQASSRPPIGRTAWCLALVVLCVLGYFAWRFYLERTACFDSAFFSWLMIDAKRPISVLGRIGSWLPQIVPVFLVRSGADLSAVLRTYSMCLFGVHVAALLVCAVWLRDRAAVIVLPVMLVAGFHYLFYYGISELYQGLSVMLITWVLVRRFAEATPDQARRWWWAAFAVNAWCSCYHQLLVLPLVFLLAYEAFNAQRWRSRRYLLLCAALVCTFAVRFMLVPSSTYEQERMPTAHDLFTYVFQLRSLQSTAYLLMVWTKFKSLLLLMAVAGTGLLWQRQWKKLGWTIGFSAGYIALILIVDRNGMAPTIYENYYPVLGLVWGVPFAELLMEASAVRWRKWALHATWCLVLALGLSQIWRGHYRISEKVAYAERITHFMRERGIRKATARMVDLPWTYVLGHWSLAMETALVSAAHGPKQAATLYISDDTALVDTMGRKPDRFLGPTWCPIWFELHNLDQRYFSFPRRAGYTPIATALPDSLWRTFPFTSITLTAPTDTVRLAPDRFSVVPVVIANAHTMHLPARRGDGTPVRLRYRLLRPDGSLYQDGSEMSALEADVPAGTSYPQGFVIERPKDAGLFHVEVWLTTDGAPLGPRTAFWVRTGRFGS